MQDRQGYEHIKAATLVLRLLDHVALEGSEVMGKPRHAGGEHSRVFHFANGKQVVVRVNDAWLERIRPRIDAIAHAQGFAGRIVILA